MKRSNLARRRQRAKKVLRDAERYLARAFAYIDDDVAFRTRLGRLVLTEEDYQTFSPTFGQLRMGAGHPSLRPILLQRVKELLEKANKT